MKRVKLTLNRETVRHLEMADMRLVGGGAEPAGSVLNPTTCPWPDPDRDPPSFTCK